MHTLQFMLVEAEDAEDAIASVTNEITHAEVPYPAWSDWHEIGGRWSGVFEGWDDTKDVLCYADNEILAKDIIEKCVGERVATMKHFMNLVETEKLSVADAIAQYNPNKQDYPKMHTVWAMKQICNLLSEYWTCDSGLYDLTAHTTGLEFFNERVEKNPTKQFLVPVDFHF